MRVAALLAAWVAWDARPRSARRALAMERAAAAVARSLPMSPTSFRHRLALHRRAGFDHEQAAALAMRVAP